MTATATETPDTVPTATWTKWRKTNTWAMRIDGKVKDGTVIKVTKKSGEVAFHQAEKTLWSGKGVSVVAPGKERLEWTGSAGGLFIVADSGDPPVRRGGIRGIDTQGRTINPAPRRRSNGRCKSRGCSAQATDRGYCGRCAFDEFDGC